MSHETAYSGPEDHVQTPANPAQDAPRIVNEAKTIMWRARESLKRFAARYAESPAAKAAAKEARLIVEAIDDWILKQ